MTTKGGTLHHVQAVTGGNLLIGNTKQTNFSKRGAIPQGKHSFNRIDSREEASLHIADTGPIQPVPFHSYRARSGCTNRINGICMSYQKNNSFTYSLYYAQYIIAPFLAFDNSGIYAQAAHAHRQPGSHLVQPRLVIPIRVNCTHFTELSDISR